MCTHVKVNANMVPADTTPGIGGGEDEVEWLKK
jgi:hypothetical protein